MTVSEDAPPSESGDAVEEAASDDGRYRDRLESVSRRQFLLGTGATVGAVGGGRAAYNTMLGYGEFGYGTNLVDQDLEPLLTDHLRLTYDETFEDVRVWLADDGVGLATDGSMRFVEFDDSSDSDANSAVATLDADFDLDGRLSGLYSVGTALNDDEFAFEFHQPAAFFDRVTDADASPDAVAALRGGYDRTVEPATVERFAGADPTDPPAVIEGLVDGFREHSSYDVPRYLAGSIEDNVIFGVTDLRRHFTSPVDFESLLDAGGTGMFCWEYVFRSMEALHAVPPWAQTVPVATFYVSDRRHKHAFTGVASAIYDDGLRFPITFVDYTYATLYDDFRLRWLLGEGLAAYDSRHRADEIYW